MIEGFLNEAGMSSPRETMPSMIESVLQPDVEARIVRKALLSRRVEERLLALYQEGRVFGTVHTCIGQEFVGAVISEFLRSGDSVFSNHRCHGHFLSITSDVDGLIAEVMGREAGVCGGRGGSQHLCKDGFYSNGIQGGIVPVSAGLAFARKIRDDGTISVVFVGDGTLGEGVLYESLNIASKWELPLLVVLENNGYAQSTSREQTLAGNICARAEAFGIRTAMADTWEWRKLYGIAEELTSYVRSERRPAFLQIDTYRLKAHSKGDDDRPRSEVEAYERRDPLNILMAGSNDGTLAESADVDGLIDGAVERAEEAPFSIPSSDPASRSAESVEWTPIVLERRRVGKALNQMFHELMAAHPEALFIGEDVESPYGGAFKISDRLSDRFPDRVRNTPISEAAVVGVGSGLALEGFLPIVEIMFGDFMGLAFDQLLNHASKFGFMYDGQVSTNVIVRTPMGGGRGYGPTHSQTLDPHLLGIPGLRVLAINNLLEPGTIYGKLLATSKDPTVVIENKLLYTEELRDRPPDGFQLLKSNDAYPTIHIRPEALNVDATLFGYGAMGETLVKAADLLFQQHDIVAQVVCPTQIYPLDIGPVLQSIPSSPLVVVAEEGQGFAGFGAEILAQITEIGPRPFPVMARVAPSHHPIPASRPWEAAALPGVDDMIQTVLEMIDDE